MSDGDFQRRRSKTPEFPMKKKQPCLKDAASLGGSRETTALEGTEDRGPLAAFDGCVKTGLVTPNLRCLPPPRQERMNEEKKKKKRGRKKK